uniref:Uncharacterized protein n=1 Tax=Zea mays TaxID=4577 RepID=A0A804R0H7_MAIZE
MALHANTTGIHYPWQTCSNVIGSYWADSPRSMLPIYQELIAAGIKIWVFSNTDDVIPVTATRYSIDALKLPTAGGWNQVYKGQTLVTIAGAGHEVPLHRPRQALIMFRHFLQNKPMPTKKIAN